MVVVTVASGPVSAGNSLVFPANVYPCRDFFRRRAPKSTDGAAKPRCFPAFLGRWSKKTEFHAGKLKWPCREMSDAKLGRVARTEIAVCVEQCG